MEVDSSAKIDTIQNINLDTTAILPPKTSLQSVSVKVADKENLEFMLDGGAVVFVIPLHIIRQLGKETELTPSNKTLKYSGGEIDIPAGVIKLKLQFSEEIIIHHVFCVTKNPNTPLLLGMDFLLATRAIQDPLNDTLTFRTEDGDVKKDYVISTHFVDGQYEANSTGDGLLDGGVIIPVSVTRSKTNANTKEINIGYEWKFEPGEAQLLWIVLDEESNNWDNDMVLQPASKLFSKLGLFLVPTVLTKTDKKEPYCTIVVNMTQKEVLLKKGEILGQLFNRSLIPHGASMIKSVDEIMYIITELYINHHDLNENIAAPSFLEGPIFEPTKEELKSLGIDKTKQEVNTITWGSTHENKNMVEELLTLSVQDDEAMDWDINPDLPEAQRQQIKEVLIKYKSVFATSLSEIKSLNIEPYIIKVKPGVKPVKTSPRMLPYVANEWLKDYITQLIELDMLEPCSGLWAAAVVLVPNNKKDRQPRRRFKKVKRVPKIVTVPGETKPKTIWFISEFIEERIHNTNLSTLEEVKQNHYQPDKIVSAVPEQLAVSGTRAR